MIEQLRARGRNAYLLRIASMFSRGMNTNQIANVLGVSEAQIWNDMGQARRAWRDLFAKG